MRDDQLTATRGESGPLAAIQEIAERFLDAIDAIERTMAHTLEAFYLEHVQHAQQAAAGDQAAFDHYMQSLSERDDIREQITRVVMDAIAPIVAPLTESGRAA